MIFNVFTSLLEAVRCTKYIPDACLDKSNWVDNSPALISPVSTLAPRKSTTLICISFSVTSFNCTVNWAVVGLGDKTVFLIGNEVGLIFSEH